MCGSNRVFYVGYNISVLNTVINIIADDLGWCSDSQKDCSRGLLYTNLLSSVIFLGAAIGCVIGGAYSDRNGRRSALLVSHYMYISSAALIAYNRLSSLILVLVLSRGLTGVAIGIGTVVTPLYITEMTHHKHRGFYGTMNQLWITVGILVGISVGFVLDYSSANISDDSVHVLTWRGLLVLPVLALSIVSVLLFKLVFIFDTPHYCIQSHFVNTNTAAVITTSVAINDEGSCLRLSPSTFSGSPYLKDANYVLSLIYTNDVDTANRQFFSMYDTMKDYRGKSKFGDNQKIDVSLCGILWGFRGDEHLEEGEELGAVNDADGSYNNRCSILKTQYRYVMWIAIFLGILPQLTGINVFIACSTSIFVTNGISLSFSKKISILMALANVIATIPSVLVIDTLGRKRLLIYGIIGQIIGLSIPSIVTITMCFARNSDETMQIWINISTIVGVIMFVVSFAFGLGAVPAVYLNEILPTPVKSQTSGLAFALSWIVAFILVSGSQLLPMGVANNLFLALSILGLLFVCKYVRETRGLDADRSPYITVQTHSVQTR